MVEETGVHRENHDLSAMNVVWTHNFSDDMHWLQLQYDHDHDGPPMKYL
jgi:hypothetical protein